MTFGKTKPNQYFQRPSLGKSKVFENSMQD